MPFFRGIWRATRIIRQLEFCQTTINVDEKGCLHGEGFSGDVGSETVFSERFVLCSAKCVVIISDA